MRHLLVTISTLALYSTSALASHIPNDGMDPLPGIQAKQQAGTPLTDNEQLILAKYLSQQAHQAAAQNQLRWTQFDDYRDTIAAELKQYFDQSNKTNAAIKIIFDQIFSDTATVDSITATLAANGKKFSAADYATTIIACRDKDAVPAIGQQLATTQTSTGQINYVDLYLKSLLKKRLTSNQQTQLMTYFTRQDSIVLDLVGFTRKQMPIVNPLVKFLKGSGNGNAAIQLALQALFKSDQELMPAIQILVALGKSQSGAFDIATQIVTAQPMTVPMSSPPVESICTEISSGKSTVPVPIIHSDANSTSITPKRSLKDPIDDLKVNVVKASAGAAVITDTYRAELTTLANFSKALDDLEDARTSAFIAQNYTILTDLFKSRCLGRKVRGNAAAAISPTKTALVTAENLLLAGKKKKVLSKVEKEQLATYKAALKTLTALSKKRKELAETEDALICLALSFVENTSSQKRFVKVGDLTKILGHVKRKNGETKIPFNQWKDPALKAFLKIAVLGIEKTIKASTGYEK